MSDLSELLVMECAAVSSTRVGMHWF